MDEMPDRRRVARVIVPWHLSARVLDSHDVRILDLSTAGVGIEHVEPLQPGASCTLEFPLPFGSLRLTARVVWSLLKGGGQIREGDRGPPSPTRGRPCARPPPRPRPPAVLRKPARHFLGEGQARGQAGGIDAVEVQQAGDAVLLGALHHEIDEATARGRQLGPHPDEARL